MRVTRKLGKVGPGAWARMGKPLRAVKPGAVLTWAQPEPQPLWTLSLLPRPRGSQSSTAPWCPQEAVPSSKDRWPSAGLAPILSHLLPQPTPSVLVTS